jgi:hypothetical protein
MTSEYSATVKALYEGELAEFDRLFGRMSTALTANTLIAGGAYYAITEGMGRTLWPFPLVLAGVTLVVISVAFVLLAMAAWPRQYLRIDMARVAAWRSQYQQMLAHLPKVEQAAVLETATADLLQAQQERFGLFNQEVTIVVHGCSTDRSVLPRSRWSHWAY